LVGKKNIRPKWFAPQRHQSRNMVAAQLRLYPVCCGSFCDKIKGYEHDYHGSFETRWSAIHSLLAEVRHAKQAYVKTHPQH
jgi:hypothetical protein